MDSFSCKRAPHYVSIGRLVGLRPCLLLHFLLLPKRACISCLSHGWVIVDLILPHHGNTYRVHENASHLTKRELDAYFEQKMQNSAYQSMPMVKNHSRSGGGGGLRPPWTLYIAVRISLKKTMTFLDFTKMARFRHAERPRSCRDHIQTQEIEPNRSIKVLDPVGPQKSKNQKRIIRIAQMCNYLLNID